MDLTRAYLIYLALASGGYTLAAHAPYRGPWTIGAAALDGAIPFWPAAAWPYLTYFLVLPALLVLGRRRRGVTAVAWTGMACGLANVLLYLAVPTRLADRPGAEPGSLLALVQRLDPPLNAIPSGHVALPLSIAAAAWLAGRPGHGDARRWRRLAALFFAWTALLAASALLTKQHYAIDVAAGALFGLTVAGLAEGVRRARSVWFGPTVAAFAAEWCVLAAVLAAAVRWWSLPAALFAMLVVATRQHALLALYHDGVHGLVARCPRWNDFSVNSTSGVPLLMPVHLYRALHLLHHRELGTERDPERTILYRGQPWRYRPLPAGTLLRQLAGDLLLWNSVHIGRGYLARLRFGAASGPRTVVYPELGAQLVLFGAGWTILAAAAPAAALRLAVLWFVPYLTLTQVLNKLRSFGEHTDPEAGTDLSYSWNTGWLGRLTLWPYHINYHREHHAHPHVPWNRLPVLFAHVPQTPARRLWTRVWAAKA